MLARKFFFTALLSIMTIISGQELPKHFPWDKEGQQYDLNQKMSINMKDSDIKNVLMLIGELTGLNIVISPSVKDTITASLENVSVKAALDAILKPNGYSYFTQENIIIVKGMDVDMVGELETIVVKLKYINAKDLQSPLGAVFTSRGKMQTFIPLITSQSQSGASNGISCPAIS